MSRMKNVFLVEITDVERERVTNSLLSHPPACRCVGCWIATKLYDAPDFETAVEAAARRLVWEQHQGCVQWDDDPTDTATSGSDSTRRYALAHARAALEAALTATDGGHDV